MNPFGTRVGAATRPKQAPMIIALTAAAVTLLAPAAARAEPANSLKDMFAQLNQCLARTLAPVGTDVTVLFMVDRRGALIGKPRLVHAVWPRDADLRGATARLASSFNRCLPLSITDALGGAVAGRLISFRVRTGAVEQKA